MRLLIASDIHGSASRTLILQTKVKEIKPDFVVLLGDLLYHGPRNPLPEGYDPQKVVAILSDLGAPVIAIRGNCDAEVDQMVLPWQLAEISWILTESIAILAIHGHQLPENSDEIKVKAGSAILSGHTHIPTAENAGRFHRWNPGSLSLPKAGYPPSFGLYENKEFNVWDLAGNILMSDRL